MRLDHLGLWFAPDLQLAQHEDDIGSAHPPGEKRRRLPWPRDPEKRIKNTYDIVRRWQRLGLARLEKPFGDEPMWCWVTMREVQELGLAYDAGFPVLADLAYLYQINRTRL